MGRDLGSSDFSEKISASKYPGYAEYQRKVGRFLPFSENFGEVFKSRKS